MAKILIVEDDPLIIRMYQNAFKFIGYDVATAIDGQEGLEAANNLKPTIILLDIMMPKLNGLEVLEKLKENSETKNIPVIMLTNLAGTQDAERALTLGAVKYIVKSEYKPKQIVDMTKEIMLATTRDEVPQIK